MGSDLRRDLKTASKGGEQIAIGSRDLLSQRQQNRIVTSRVHRAQIVAHARPDIRAKRAGTAASRAEKCLAVATDMAGSAQKTPSPGSFATDAATNSNQLAALTRSRRVEPADFSRVSSECRRACRA